MSYIENFYYPSFDAPLTAEQMRIMQYKMSAKTKGIIWGLDVIRQGGLYIVTNGTFVKDGLVVKIENDHEFITTLSNFEFLIKLVPNSILETSNVLAEINIYNIGTYDSNPNLYVKLATIQNNKILYLSKENRQIYRTIIFSASTPSSELRTQGIYWFNPFCINRRAKLSVWTGIEWKPIVTFKCIKSGQGTFWYEVNKYLFTVFKSTNIQTLDFYNIITPINDYTGTITFEMIGSRFITLNSSPIIFDDYTNDEVVSSPASFSIDPAIDICPHYVVLKATDSRIERSLVVIINVVEAPTVGTYILEIRNCVQTTRVVRESFNVDIVAIPSEGFYGDILVTPTATSDLIINTTPFTLTIPRGSTTSNVHTLNITIKENITSRENFVTFSGISQSNSSNVGFEDRKICNVNTSFGSFRLVITGCNTTPVTRGSTFNVSVKAVAIDGFYGEISVQMNLPSIYTTTFSNPFTLIIPRGSIESQTRVIPITYI